MAKWAPSEYAWFCNHCPEVALLDGSIDPDDTTTWEYAKKKRNKKALYKSIAANFKRLEKQA